MEQKRFTVLTEEMFKFVTPKYTVRMWLPLSQPFGEKDLYPYPQSIYGTDVVNVDSEWMKSNIEKCIESNWKDLGMAELGMRLLSAYEANAVEVLDKDGNGKVFYNDWP
jgi:hypothetical protein